VCVCHENTTTDAENKNNTYTPTTNNTHQPIPNNHHQPTNNLVDDISWHGSIKEPWEKRERSCLPLIQELMSATIHRHSREQRTAADGKPLVALPYRTTVWVPVVQVEGSQEEIVSRALEGFAAQTVRHRY
jgi:hypothetical protein